MFHWLCVNYLYFSINKTKMLDLIFDKTFVFIWGGGISRVCLRYMCGISEYIWGISGIYLGNIWDISGEYLGFIMEMNFEG